MLQLRGKDTSGQIADLSRQSALPECERAWLTLAAMISELTNKVLGFCVALLCSTLLPAQNYIAVGVDFGGMVRGGQWSEIHGPTLGSGARVELANTKGLIFGAQGQIFFSNRIKVDPIEGLRNEFGAVWGDLATQVRPANIDLRSRAWTAQLMVGYHSSFGESKWGYRGLIGPLFGSHHIRIQDDATFSTSNLRNEYKRGYDRRAAGFGLGAEAGIQYEGSVINTFLVAQAMGLSSQPLRDTQFDLQAPAPDEGTDLGFGLKVGFILKLGGGLSGNTAEDIYY